MSEGKFYKDAARYWANVPATIDGVLGGYGHISNIDIHSSRIFLDKIFAMKNPPGSQLAMDCGAGIGRVTKFVLMPRFDKVDLIEQDEKFINKAEQFVGKDNPKLGTLYCVGLQNFQFDPNKKYDVIWCQWVLGHIDDFSLIAFLKNCCQSLSNTGVIVIKENVTTSEERDFDEEDSSVTRPLSDFLNIFKNVHLKILLTEIQTDFPDDIYPVHSFVVAPKSQSETIHVEIV